MQHINDTDLSILFSKDSLIEVLDLSYSTVDDTGLSIIGSMAHHLKELNIKGGKSFSPDAAYQFYRGRPGLRVIY